MVLVAHLPRESSLVTATLGEPAEWAITDHLVAHAVDGINQLLYAYVASHSKQRPPAPKPVPRPQTRQQVRAAEKRRLSTPNEVSAFFASISNAGR